MRKLFGISLILLFLTSCASWEKIQTQEENRVVENELMARLPFELVYASYANDSLFSRLDLYIGIHFKNLVFEKSDTDFVARYEINLDFYKLPLREHVMSDFWENEARVNNYSETQKQGRGIRSLHSYSIKPGEYEARITVTDKNVPQGTVYATKKVSKIIAVYDYQRQFMISDVMLVDRVRFWGKKGRAEELSPSFWRSSAGDSLLRFYFEVYNLKPDTTMKIFYSVADRNGKMVLGDSIYTNSFYSAIGYILSIPMKDIPNGTYLLNVSVAQDSFYFSRGLYFGFYYWLSADFAIKNLDEAVRQLRYIVPYKELKKMKMAESKEKERLFLEYWKSKDPSPATADNELMEEYYGRVEFANKYFRFSNQAGWETDRGMIYITFGEPDDIYSRSMMEVNTSPYEIWTYWNIKRRKLVFIFVDKWSIGDYRLTEPFDPFHPFH